MHPLKDQREGVKYGRGVKYGVTPAASEVRENSNRYTTEPPKNSVWKLIDKGILLGFTIHYILQQ